MIDEWMASNGVYPSCLWARGIHPSQLIAGLTFRNKQPCTRSFTSKFNLESRFAYLWEYESFVSDEQEKTKTVPSVSAVCMLMQQHRLWGKKKKKRSMKAFPHPSPLQEERHQLQLHPPVSGDNGTLRSRDSKSRPGSITPTMRVSLPALLRHIKHSSKMSFPPARRAH